MTRPSNSPCMSSGDDGDAPSPVSAPSHRSWSAAECHDERPMASFGLKRSVRSSAPHFPSPGCDPGQAPHRAVCQRNAVAMAAQNRNGRRGCSNLQGWLRARAPPRRLVRGCWGRRAGVTRADVMRVALASRPLPGSPDAAPDHDHAHGCGGARLDLGRRARSCVRPVASSSGATSPERAPTRKDPPMVSRWREPRLQAEPGPSTKAVIFARTLRERIRTAPFLSVMLTESSAEMS